MALSAKRISLWDTLRLQAFVTVPAYVWGLVVPWRPGVAFLSWLNAGQALQRFLDSLRRKYDSDHLWAWFPFGQTLLVFNPGSMDTVLKSKQNAPDPFLKKLALSRFVPDGLIISSGDASRRRRAFNERVLDFGHLHRDADTFAEIVVREVGQRMAKPLNTLRWADFKMLGERISQQVLLGFGRIDPALAQQLATLGRWSNLPLRHGSSFRAFYATIESYLSQHHAPVRRRDLEHADEEPVAARCLLHRSAESLEHGDATASTCVPRQVGFWAFVLKDAVELHVARTLALIAAHPEVQDRLRRDILSIPTLSAQSIDGLGYLDACLVEQLRLWTPVPILLRRAVTDFSFGDGISIKAEQQILIHAGYHHRDPGVFGESADRFSPDAVDDRVPVVFFFSRHERSCAGQFLARFLIKATLASLLARFRFELIRPCINLERLPHLYNHFDIEVRGFEDG
jgi:cytochrome P450